MRVKCKIQNCHSSVHITSYVDTFWVEKDNRIDSDGKTGCRIGPYIHIDLDRQSRSIHIDAAMHADSTR